MKLDDKGGMGAANFAKENAEGGACASGGGTGTGEMPLDPYPGKYPERSGQPCGPCSEDGSFRGLETALVLRRYATVFAQVVRTAGGDLQVLATTNSTRLIAWDAGSGENGNTSGLLPTNSNLTRAETDGYTDGALAPDQKWDFRAVGMGVQVLEAFRAATVSGDTNGRIFDPFWTLGDYSVKLARALCRCGHISFRHGKADFAYEMGRLDFYPSMSSLDGPDGGGVMVGNPLAAAFVPLRVPDFAGGPTDDDALEVELSIDRSFQVSQDPLVPVPALGAGEAYLLPVTFELYGSTVRNSNIVDKKGVEAVARGAIVDVVAGLAEDIDPNNPESVRLFQRMLTRLRNTKG